MADKFNVDYGAFRPVGLTKSRTEAAARVHALKTERYESYIQIALQMPMYKNLPTCGFKYDWMQFRDHDGVFVFGVTDTDDSNHHIINDRVKHLSPKEMDRFCAEVFNKATELLANVPRAKVEDFWAKVAQEIGIQLLEKWAYKRAFYDWAMKIVAARIFYGQEESHLKLQSPPERDNTGDIKMSDQPTQHEPGPKRLSLAARAVDKFLSVGISKYGTSPMGLWAITRHHTVTTPTKSGSDNASKKDSSTAKDIAENTQVHKPHQVTRATPKTKTSVHLRRSPFGSHVGAGDPAWWGFINRSKASEEMSTSQQVRNEPQNRTVTAQGSRDEASTVDDLIIGMHGTAMEDATPAPQVLTNLAIRTIIPLKRRRDDAEGAEDGPIGDQPLAKIAKTFDENANNLSPPSQLQEP